MSPTLFSRIDCALPIVPTMLACLFSCCLCPSGQAQITLDGSLTVEGERALSGPNYQILEADGKLTGNNLFHSFRDFSLPGGNSATFSGSADIRNVLSRVTGGNASTIDGALISTIPGANFFFINPYGVFFGPGASIDVGGAFTVTTAHHLNLADGAVFSATPGGADFSLTSADVASFGFLS